MRSTVSLSLIHISLCGHGTVHDFCERLDRIGDDDLGKGKRLDGEFVRHGNQGDRNADSDALDLSV